MFLESTRQEHTLECRERVPHLMNDEEKVKRAREKRLECEERMEEETRRRETKKQRKEERKVDKRGKRREAEGDPREEEEPSSDMQENKDKGDKIIAGEGLGTESEGAGRPSGDRMTVEVVSMDWRGSAG